MKCRRPNGFTLIELMITVVIIGILAAIAYPSYSRYTTQTRRSDAQIALTRAANLEEKFYSDCGHYAQTLTGAARACGTLANNYSDGVLAMSNAATILSDDGHYVITLVAPTASAGSCPITRCFYLQATPATTAQGGSGRQIGNGKLRIGSTGLKTWDKANTNTPSDSTPGNYLNKWTDK